MNAHSQETVLKWLNLCDGESRCKYPNCPYNKTKRCIQLLHADAITLMKAHEPRLVTEEDFDHADNYGYLPAWTEEKDGDIYCECIPKIALAESDNNVEYRFWMSCPTDELRRAVKWKPSKKKVVD